MSLIADIFSLALYPFTSGSFFVIVPILCTFACVVFALLASLIRRF